MARKVTEPTREHNQPGPAEFAAHWREVRAARRTLDEANGVYRAKLKAAKSAGFNPSVLTELMRLSRQDPEAVEQHQRELARLAAWANIPIGGQPDMFDPPPDAVAASIREDDVRQAGYDAALRGDPADDMPHPPGTPHAVVWREGFDAGREFMTSAGRADTRAPRGRRRRRGNPEDAAVAAD